MTVLPRETPMPAFSADMRLAALLIAALAASMPAVADETLETPEHTSPATTATPSTRSIRAKKKSRRSNYPTASLTSSRY